MQNKALFFDRDDTLIVDKNYMYKVADLEYFPDTIPTLKKLQELGFLLFIITNQSGVGRGYFSVEQMHEFNNHMISDLASQGIEIKELVFCPHAPEDNCECRKPKPKPKPKVKPKTKSKKKKKVSSAKAKAGAKPKAKATKAKPKVVKKKTLPAVPVKKKSDDGDDDTASSAEEEEAAEAAAEEKMSFCGECGTPALPNTRFCLGCGMHL